MYEPSAYETDEEIEQALYAAFVREPAPDTLILRVEQRLLAARRAPAVPGFRLLSVSTRSAWSSLWSIAAHASVFALIVLLMLHAKKDSVHKTVVTQIDVMPFVPVTAQDNRSGRWWGRRRGPRYSPGVQRKTAKDRTAAAGSAHVGSQ